MLRPLILSFAVLAALPAGSQMCMPPPEQSKVVAYPSGTLIAEVGTSDFPVTTQNPKCRDLVRNGFALIHCFWFNEAIRVFRDAVAEDPGCATAWCGLHIALVQPWFGGPKKESEYAIQRAVAQSGSAGPLEQGLVAAFRARSAGGGDAAAKWEAAMLRLIADHPRAVEPKLLLAGIKAQLCMGINYDTQGNKAGELSQIRRLMEPLLPAGKSYPGIYHYYIHAVEGSKPDLAVPAADLLTRYARGSAHMVHMPGHIYCRVGQYEKGKKAFADAKAIEEGHAKNLGVHPSQASWNYGHNVAFLAYNFVEMGDFEAALALAEGRYGRQTILWRAGKWGELAKDLARDRDSASGLFFQGMDAVERGELDAAALHWKKLRAIADEKWKTPPTRGALTDALVARCMELELGGSLMVRRGFEAVGIAKLREAVGCFERIAYEEPPYYARPTHETLGAELLRLGRFEEAEAAFRRGLLDRRNSPWMLRGIEAARNRKRVAA